MAAEFGELFHRACLNIDSPIVSGKCGAAAKSPLAAEKGRDIDPGIAVL